MNKGEKDNLNIWLLGRFSSLMHRFPYLSLSHRDKTKTYLIELVWGLNVLLHVKCQGQCFTYIQWSIKVHNDDDGDYDDDDDSYNCEWRRLPSYSVQSNHKMCEFYLFTFSILLLLVYLGYLPSTCSLSPKWSPFLESSPSNPFCLLWSKCSFQNKSWISELIYVSSSIVWNTYFPNLH